MNQMRNRFLMNPQKVHYSSFRQRPNQETIELTELMIKPGMIDDRFLRLCHNSGDAFMKPKYALIFGVIMILLSYSHAHSEKTVLITGCEWPPYMSVGLDHYGYASRIASEAFSVQGIRMKLDFFPRKRSLYEANPRKGWDGSILWFKSPAIEKDYYVSEPVVNTRFVFFHLKANPFVCNTIEDLKKYKIGGVLEHDYGEEFEKAEQSGFLRVERVPNDEQNLKKLIYGRIDAFIQDIDVGLALLGKLSPDEAERITFIPKPLKSGPMCLILSKMTPENKDIIEAFDKGLKIIRSSGRYSEIMQPFYESKLMIIANKGVKDKEITKEDLRAFYFGKKTRWSDDKRIVICGLKEGMETEIFMNYYIKTTPSKFLEFWNKILFSGKGQPPPIFSDKKEYLDFIKKTEGAVGYMFNDFPAEDLKVMEVR